MKKLFIGILFLTALLCSYGWMERAHFASRILSENSGMQVTVSDVSLFPLTLKNIQFVDKQTKTDVHVGAAIIHAPLTGFLGDPIVIHKLTLKDTTVISQIDPLDMVKFSSLLSLANNKKAPSPAPKGKKIQIDDFSIEKLYAEVPNPFDDGEKIRLKIPEFSLSHISDMSLSELLTKVVHQAKKR